MSTYTYEAAKTGLDCSDNTIENSTGSEVQIQYVNASGPHHNKLQDGQSVPSIYGLFDKVTVTNNGDWTFPGVFTALPSTKVTITLEEKVVYVSFTNVQGGADKVALEEKDRWNLVPVAGLFLHEGRITNDTGLAVVITVAELFHRRTFTLEVKRTSGPLTAVFEIVTLLGGGTWKFATSYKVAPNTTVAITVDNGNPIATFDDVNGVVTTVKLVNYT